MIKHLSGIHKTGVWLLWCVCLTTLVQAQDNAEIVTEIDEDKAVNEMIMADPPETQETEAKSSAVIKREHISQISRSLKGVIEQNRKLSEERDRLDAELRRLRGVQRFEKNKIKDTEDENMQLLQRIEELQSMKGDHQRALKELQETFSKEKQSFEQQIVELQKQIEEAKEVQEPLSSEDVLVEDGDAGLGLIAMLDELVDERKQADQDEARLHYNMGNVFFHRGEYKRAEEEYTQAVEIDPSNANAHFNLALVLGDYKKDYRLAIRHYNEYLYLNPQAEDRMLVKEKILEAKLALHSVVSKMSVEKDLYEHREFDYTW